MTRLKPYWTLALIILLPTLFLGCAGETFTNSFAPSVGDKRQVQTASALTTSIAIMGRNIDTSTNYDMTFSLEVTEVLPDGNVTLQVTIDDVAMDQTMPQIPGMDLGTALADMQKTVKAALAEAKQEQFALKVTPAGDVVLSTDLMDLADRVKRKANVSGGNAMMANAAIDQYLGAKALEEAVVTVVDCYRDMPSKAGDTWTDTKTVSAGLPITINSTFTLGALTDFRYEVSEAMELTASGAPPNMPGMPPGMDVQVSADMAGPGTGTYAVDRKTSWLTSANAQFKLEGTISIGGMPGAGDMGMDMTLSGTETVTVTPL